MRLLTTVLAAGVLFLASCNKFEQTKSGFKYKITASPSKEKIKQGDIVKYHEELKIEGKDTVLKSTFGDMPSYLPIDSTRLPKHYFTEVITKLGKGDKMEYVMSVDSLIKLQMIPAYDKQFKKGGIIKGKIEILQVFKADAEARADFDKESAAAQEKAKKKMEKESAGEIAKEKTAIAKYVADNKLTTVTTPSGTLVSIENAGDATAKADSGKMAHIYYKGSLLSNGQEFDSNIKGGVKGKTLDVLVGVPNTPNSVIKGMDEALRLFGKGGKGKMIIPFSIGYGAQGSPPVIPAYSTLVFDIEMADVTVPAPPAAAPAQPGQPK